MSLQQPPAFRPFMGKLTTLTLIALGASQNFILWVVPTPTRQGDNMINMVFGKKLTTIIASVFLMLQLSLFIKSTLIYWSVLFVCAATMLSSSVLLRIYFTPLLAISYSFSRMVSIVSTREFSILASTYFQISGIILPILLAQKLSMSLSILRFTKFFLLSIIYLVLPILFAEYLTVSRSILLPPLPNSIGVSFSVILNIFPCASLTYCSQAVSVAYVTMEIFKRCWVFIVAFCASLTGWIWGTILLRHGVTSLCLKPRIVPTIARAFICIQYSIKHPEIQGIVPVNGILA